MMILTTSITNRRNRKKILFNSNERVFPIYEKLFYCPFYSLFQKETTIFYNINTKAIGMHWTIWIDCKNKFFVEKNLLWSMMCFSFLSSDVAFAFPFSFFIYRIIYVINIENVYNNHNVFYFWSTYLFDDKFFCAL